jgi:hypothetical protein
MCSLFASNLSTFLVHLLEMMEFYAHATHITVASLTSRADGQGCHLNPRSGSAQPKGSLRFISYPLLD